MKNENDEDASPGKKPFTVSAVYADSFEAMIAHCLAADAQAARDDVLMRTGGAVLIASVFAGHLHEPDAIVYELEAEVSLKDEAASIGR